MGKKKMNDINTHMLSICSSYFLVTYFNISSVDINQCATNDDIPFGGTHKCPSGLEVPIFSSLTFSLSIIFL